MTDPMSPFGQQRDAALGDALRAALGPGDQAAFVARVLAGFDAARAPYWVVLAQWARRGLAAAAVAALVAGFLVGRTLPRPASLDDAYARSAEPQVVPATALLTSQRPPDASLVLASVVER